MYNFLYYATPGEYQFWFVYSSSIYGLQKWLKIQSCYFIPFIVCLCDFSTSRINKPFRLSHLLIIAASGVSLHNLWQIIGRILRNNTATCSTIYSMVGLMYNAMRLQCSKHRTNQIVESLFYTYPLLELRNIFVDSFRT